MSKKAEYYMSLPYTIELWRASEGGWVVRVKELPGCVSQGETAEEALTMIQDAMRGWLEVALEYGDPIPEPRPEEEYSGKFVVRVPRTLHRELVAAADREGVSLNQYINTVLAQAVGRATPTRRPRWPDLAEVLDPLVRRLEKAVQQLDLALTDRSVLPDMRAGQGYLYRPQPAAALALHENAASYEANAAQPPTPTGPDKAESDVDASGDIP